MALSTFSSSSSASSSREWKNDLFLSFSGEDIRKNLLSHLYKEHDRKPILVFKDNEIKKGQSLGPKLKRAIRDSRIAVVIFSKKYASSSWCLNELLEIVKCKKKFNQVVIPIFFRLDPTHVRKQTGVFGTNFEKTCCNKTEKLEIRWRKALTDVANIMGYHSSVTCETEAKMIEAIINDVLDELALTQSKDSEDFIGIEAHIEKINFFLRLESEEVRMVGILGPSGIGKTTIARVLFNRLSRGFRFNVFIDRAFLSKNMEHYSGANLDDYNMKLHLQRMFVSEILGKRDIKICALGAVGEWLKNHKVLIFIDDLKNQVVLDTLVGHTHWFGCGSRIIVITAEKHLLKAHGIDLIYEVPLPSDALALQILCRFAFRQNYPPDGFMELASETALCASKLPLVLKVLGSHLRGRDKKDWMDMLQMFRNGQHGKIEETLKLSYHGLNNKGDEAIFRHIACFFNGEKVDDIKSLLADSDLDVDTGIQNLVDKSLIQETCNTVEMHSLLQEMGQEINRAQSSEPGEREFLVDAKDICNVLENNTGTEKVLGISLDIDETDELHIHESAFKMMRRLRYLRISNKGKKEDRLHLSEDVEFSHELRLLSWENFSLRSMPSKFRPQNLVNLKMKYSSLEKLWDGILPLGTLKKMDLLGSKNLKQIPDLSMATNLETLNLGACLSLVELPSSVQYLNKLKELDMSFCINLKTLPTNINLQSLDRLDLFGCSRLRSFPKISTNISYLNLSQTGIEEVPWGIQNFTEVRKLSMRGCQKLQYVSLNISKLKHLKTVNFSNCGALKVASLNGFPDNVEVSSSLADDSFPRVKLNFINCFNLDQEALLQQQSLFKILILSGEEVPSYFTHRTDRTSMTNIPLLQSSLSQPFFRLMACAVVDFESSSTCLIEVHCQFIDTLGNHFGSASWPTYLSKGPLGSHLVIFNCCLPLNGDYAYLAKRHYDHVDIQFRLTDDDSFKLKGCGIRLYEDGRN